MILKKRFSLNTAVFILLAHSALSCAFFKRPVQPAFQWPLENPKLTQKFSRLKKPPHLGIDLKADIGATVFSSHSGRVVYVGNRLTNYGNVVIVEYSQRWASLYAHLHTIKVKIGQKIKKGDMVGISGNTGKTSGPHLHFELMYNKKPINPIPYLP